jgi:hypothetical protein
MSEGIKYPVHISVPLDDHKIDWLTVRCDNESQLKQALIDSKANSEIFADLGIGDTAVDYAKLSKLKAEYTNPPTNPHDSSDIAFEEYSEMVEIERIRNDKPDINKNVKYPGKSKHFYNRQVNDVCSHNNHVSSQCSDCFDEQIYQHLAIEKLHRDMLKSPMSFVEFLRSLWYKLKHSVQAYKDKRLEEEAYNQYMRDTSR